MPLETRSGISVVVIHGTTFLVALGYTFGSRHLCTKFSYPPNDSVIFFTPYPPPDLGNREFESQDFTVASFLQTWPLPGSQTGGIRPTSVWSPVLGHSTILYVETHSMWRPTVVLWEELGHEGLRSCPLAVPHHQSGKPCQHRIKCWWWSWGYCGLSYLVKRR